MAVVAANWKMNLRRESAVGLASRLAEEGAECWLFPAFPLLVPVGEALGAGGIRLGAQDVSPEADGAFTGDVSAGMLRDAGCSLVLVGHSERRQHHGEDAALLRRKVQAASESGLEAVFCVGETLEQRRDGAAESVVTSQLKAIEALAGARVAAVAYEPVWAIGTGETATPEQAAEMHGIVRGSLDAMGYAGVPVLYGGSVKAENALELLSQPGVDGVLVGGASLTYDSLSAICRAARDAGAQGV
jgi:triosephosphate isomerase (TIM)